MGSDWLTFRAGDVGKEMLCEWNEDTSKMASRVCGREITVELILPTRNDAEVAWEHNLDLRGWIKIGGIEFKDKEEFEDQGVPIALPFDGVFLARNSEGIHPNRLVWDNCLVEKMGVRKVRPSSVHRRGAICWRIGLPNGNHIDVPVCLEGDWKLRHHAKQLARKLRELEFAKRMCGADEGVYGEFSKIVFSKELLCEYDRKKLSERRNDNREDIIEESQNRLRRLNEQLSSYSGVPCVDEDDLCHRVVWSFPRWLQHRIVGRLHDWINVNSKNGLNDQVLSIADICYGLVPLAGKGSLDHTAGDLVYISSENPIDLISHIYGVKRFNVGRRDAEDYPAEYRNNHPSFAQKICPIESPESEMVGISLQLAKGATVNRHGDIVAAADNAGCQAYFGWGMTLIPFAHHNDGARNMMGAKNLRQVLLIDHREEPSVKSGAEGEVVSRLKELRDVGICPGDEELKFGRDLLVAYMPWYGWNVDDAIVISESASKKFTVTKKMEFSRFLAAGWQVILPQPGAESFEVGKGDVVLELKNDGKVRKIVYNDNISATVTIRKLPEPSKRGLQKVSFEIARKFPLGVGDKLMGRHGNKGVISKILPDDQMPRLPDGRHVEILLNPHGVLSRMNPGQLLETHLGWLFHNDVKENEVLVNGVDRAVGYPLKGILNHEYIRAKLEETGLNREGKATLEWTQPELPNSPKNNPFAGLELNTDGIVKNDSGVIRSEQPIVVGYQYFVRLGHLPELKAQARCGGVESRYDLRSGQAAHGRMIGGGQRVGEMEMWALRAHQVDEVIQEMIGNKSDAVKVKALDDDLLAGSFKEEGSDDDVLNSGFGQYLRNWLHALLIDVRYKSGTLEFKRLDCRSKDLLERSSGCSHREVKTNPETVVPRVRFQCETCKSFFMDGHVFPEVHTKAGNSRKKAVKQYLYVGDLLSAFGYSCKGNLTYVGENKFLQKIIKIDGGHESDLHIKHEKSKGSKGRVTTLSVNVSDIEQLSEVGQFTCLLDGKNNDEALQTGKRNLGDFMVTCSRHRGKKLTGFGQNGETGEDRGGLQDDNIFGDKDDVFKEGDGGWGCIELPFEVSAQEIFKNVRGRKIRNLKQNAHDKFDDVRDYKIKVIPVLPKRYRMLMGTDGFSGVACSDVIDSEGYGPLLEEIKGWFRIKSKTDDERKIRRAEFKVKEALAQLFSLLLDRLADKEGFLRHEGLGRRVDRSFRLVIVPDPTLKIDECKIPWAVFNEVFGAKKKKAKSKGASDNCKCDRLGWTANFGEPVGSDNTTKYLLLNRQPSLHRDSILAFKAIPSYDNALVLRIPPLACKCFGADFDGDEMVGHASDDENVQKFFEGMTLRNNLISIDGGSLTYNFDRDFVSGIRLLWDGHEQSGSGLQDKLQVFCNKYSFNTLPKLQAKKDMSDWLKNDVCVKRRQVATGIIHDLMVMAFERVTEDGCSFGYYDLYDCRKNDGDGKEKIKANHSLGVIVSSGANGGDQIDQWVADRGKLLPGKLGFLSWREIEGLSDKDVGDCKELSSHGDCGFKFGCSLIEGMVWDEIFQSSYNARSSMCDKKLGTAMSGDLTRKLVFALQHIKVVKDRCECADKDRSVLNCKCKDGVCAACYGKLPDGSDPENGFPIGLIAALAIGERGTQLSMKSAHTAGGKNDFEEVRYIIYRGRTHYDCGKLIRRTKDNSSGTRKISDWKDFRNSIRAVAPDYDGVSEQHFKVLWKRLEEIGYSLVDEKGQFMGIPSNAAIDRLAFSTKLQKSVLRDVWRTEKEVPMDLNSSSSSWVMFGRHGINESEV